MSVLSVHTAVSDSWLAADAFPDEPLKSLMCVCVQGHFRFLAWGRGFPDCVLQESDSARAAPASH